MADFFIPETSTDKPCYEDPPTMVDPVNTHRQASPAAATIVDLENGIIRGADDDDAPMSTMIKLPHWQTAAPNGCAICLCENKLGDILIWSSNRSSCRHVYHQECLLEYFLTKGGADDEHSRVTTIPPCPMCRQAFVVLQTES